jgi:hypothetical protein
MTIYTLRSGGTAHPEASVLQALTDLIKTSGVYNSTSTDFDIQQQSVPDLSVLVKLGRAYIKGLSTYPVRADADETLAIASNSSGNPRIDAVVLYIDLSATANADSSNVAKLFDVQGTPAASPVAPTDGEIQTAIGASNPYIKLAEVAVASGATQILTANITEKRSTFSTYDRVISQSGSMNYGIDAGSTDAYAITIDPPITSYTAGLAIRFKANTDNTDGCTLNVNSLGATGIRKFGTQNLANGEILAGSIATVVYDGTYFQLMSVVNPDGWVDLTDGATITLDLSLGRKFRVTLGGSRTLALTNKIAGKTFILRIKQDGTPPRTVTWWGDLYWAGGSAPDLVTTANYADEFGFNCLTATNTEGFVIGNEIAI